MPKIENMFENACSKFKRGIYCKKEEERDTFDMEYLESTAMSVREKLGILSDAAKYDVACTSSGIDRKGNGKDMGNAVAAGICHSFSADGRCISLLKILLTNECIYDCKYCINRRSNDVPRAVFTPQEICDLTLNFYKRNYIEGLFLSSGIIGSPCSSVYAGFQPNTSFALEISAITSFISFRLTSFLHTTGFWVPAIR